MLARVLCVSISFPESPRWPPANPAKYGLDCKQHVVVGVAAGDVQRHHRYESVSQLLSRILWGRKLTDAEIACLIGHEMAMGALLDSDEQWCLVLEDDALPASNSAGLINNLGRTVLTSPAIFSLWSLDQETLVIDDKYSDQRESATLRAFPASAVAYLINREAATVALTRRWTILSTADWPQWSADVEFFYVRNSGMTHGEGESTIDLQSKPSGFTMKLVRLLLKVALIPYFLKPGAWGHSLSLYAKYTLVQPLRRRAARKQFRRTRYGAHRRF